MDTIAYEWTADGRDHTLELIYVEGTGGVPYSFGDGVASKPMNVRGFFIAATPVTQAFWTDVLGPETNPSLNKGMNLPVENVSWDDLTRPGGFLDRLNASQV